MVQIGDVCQQVPNGPVGVVTWLYGAMIGIVGGPRYLLGVPRRRGRRQGDGALSDWERSSTARVVSPARPRKLAKVPFVELADGRLQGVVSSGSDIGRVYVSSVSAGTFAFACSTNNNRPCGGARGSFCNHILAMINEAVLQYGAGRVARYVRVEPAGEVSAQTITSAMTRARPSQGDSSAAATVFSQFLRHLAYLEFPASTSPLPELQWFPPTRAVG
jgi:hypothetical protein